MKSFFRENPTIAFGLGFPPIKGGSIAIIFTKVSGESAS